MGRGWWKHGAERGGKVGDWKWRNQAPTVVVILQLGEIGLENI